MDNRDTISLLQECDAGSKMAVSSIDEVMEMVHCSELKDILKKSKEHHEKLGNEIHERLRELCSEGKEPSIMAKGMSWMKTNVKLGMDSGDATIADLITDGCDMGVKSLHQYLNEYEEADHSAKAACKKLIAIEEELKKKMSEYL